MFSMLYIASHDSYAFGPRSRASSAVARAAPPTVRWNLHTFPLAQAELALTGLLDVFAPVYKFGTHHGLVTAIKPAYSRRMLASCAEDKTLKLWTFPAEETEVPRSASGIGTARNVVEMVGKPRPKVLKPLRKLSETSSFEGSAACEALSTPFNSELSLEVSSYECAAALAVHPLGFQVAVILEALFGALSVALFHRTWCGSFTSRGAL